MGAVNRKVLMIKISIFAGLGLLVGAMTGGLAWLVLSLMGHAGSVGPFVFFVFVSGSVAVSLVRNWQQISTSAAAAPPPQHSR